MPLITITEPEIKEAVKKYIKDLGLSPEKEPTIELNCTRTVFTATINLTPDLMTTIAGTPMTALGSKAVAPVEPVKETPKVEAKPAVVETVKEAAPVVEKKEEPLVEEESPAVVESDLFGSGSAAPAELVEETTTSDVTADTLFAN